MTLANKRIALGVLCLSLVSASWLWWPDTASQQAIYQSHTASANGGAVFVQSMQDTVPDGNFPKPVLTAPGQAAGDLPYAELKRLFDYYLSAVGEQSIEAITLEIASDLNQRLSLAQIPSAQHLLSQYLQFKRSLVDLETNPEWIGSDAKAVRQRLLAMQDLRAQFFSAKETQGMFGFEDEYDLDTVARLEISQNPSLNELQKKQQLAALDASQSAALREAREAPRQVLNVEHMAQTLREQGASEDDVYRMRAKELTPEAAARLAELDRDEAAWKQRIEHYLSARHQLLQTLSDAPPSERDLALVQLQQSQFNADEIRRLAAYEP